MHVLNESQIVDLEFYKHDLNAQRIFSACYGKMPIYFCPTEDSLLDLSFYKLQLPAETGFGFTRKNGEQYTTGQAVLHHGLHYLVTKKFKNLHSQSAEFSLLTETIASCSEIYFALSFYSTHKHNHPLVQVYLTSTLQKFSGNDRKFMKLFNSSLKNPDLAFKSTANQMFQLLRTMHSMLYFDRKTNSKKLSNMENRLNSLKAWPLICGFQLVLFCIYTEKNRYSSQAKDKNFRQLFQTLNTADHYSVFIDKILT